ncbi:MAG: hypothetical protein CMR00_03690 [[Chlorobium] sp. 445]|nr:MAG: hypothetical protein CMR00_03690 [[Chlorobium] sp. 445]
MKKIATLFLLIVAIAFSANAQIPGLPQLLTIEGGIGGGFASGGQNLALVQRQGGLNFSDFVKDAPLSGANIAAKLKIMPPLIPLRIVGFVNYNLLSTNTNTSESISVGGTTIPLNINPFAPSGSRVNVLNAGAGLEFSPLPLPIITPYIGVDFGLYSIAPEGKSAYTRYGLGAGIGIEFSPPLIPISFDIEAKYRLANLTGKENITLTNAIAQENSFNYLQVSVMLMFKIL